MTNNRSNKHLASSAVLLGILSVAPALQAQDAPAPEKVEKKKLWSHTAGLGFTLTGGNSDTLLGTADYAGIRKWGNNEVSLGAAAGYGKSDGVVNNNFVTGFGQYNFLFGPEKRWYGFGRVEGRHDEISDIAYRVPLTAGVGYYFLKEGLNDNDKFTLAAEAGPGYAWEKVGGVTDSYATLFVGERFGWKISEKTRVWQSAGYSPSVEDFNNYTINFEAGVETQLVGDLVLRAVFSDSYRGQPAPGRESNDYKFITSIGYKF